MSVSKRDDVCKGLIRGWGVKTGKRRGLLGSCCVWSRGRDCRGMFGGEFGVRKRWGRG